MLFALWYSYWVMFAGRAGALIPPGLALITRSAYLNRSFVRWTFLLLTAAIFLWVSLISDVSWGRASLLAFQVLAFLALTRHLLSGLSEVRLHWVPLYPALIQYMASRYVRIIKERFEDIYYTARVKLSAGHQSRWKILIAAVVSAIAEFAIVKNQLFTIISARGALTHPKQWRQMNTRNAYYLTGDIVLLVLIIILASFGPDFLPTTPKTIKDITSKLPNIAG